MVASLSNEARAQDTWTTPFPGVRQLFRKAPGPLQIHALVVDLCTPGVGIRATKSSERGQKTSSFGAAVGAEAAVNGDFFNLSTFTTTGLAMGAGETWPNSGGNAFEGYAAVGPSTAFFSPPPRTGA